MSELEWHVGRVQLYYLLQEHPDWSLSQYAKAVGYSVSWVRKWRKRFAEQDEEDPSMFSSHSRARQTGNRWVSDEVEQAILEIRDNPPEGLGRVPGPKAILYYLHRQEDLKFLILQNHHIDEKCLHRILGSHLQ